MDDAEEKKVCWPAYDYPVRQIMGYMVLCPACEQGHWFRTLPLRDTPLFSFDGNLEQPTFDGEQLYEYGNRKQFEARVAIAALVGLGRPAATRRIMSLREPGYYRCCSQLRAGVWQYAEDCTHQHAGHHMPVEPISHAGWEFIDMLRRAKAMRRD